MSEKFPCEICLQTGGHSKDCSYFPDYACAEMFRLRALLASKDERIAAMEGALKDIDAMVQCAHSPRWKAVGDIAKKALASPPQPAPRQSRRNSDG